MGSLNRKPYQTPTLLKRETLAIITAADFDIISAIGSGGGGGGGGG